MNMKRKLQYDRLANDLHNADVHGLHRLIKIKIHQHLMDLLVYSLS